MSGEKGHLSCVGNGCENLVSSFILFLGWAYI